MKKYQIVYADPPWDYGKGNFPSTSATNAYPLMPVQDIAALPVREIVDRHAVLFLWATMSQLPSAFQVIEGWGFRYVTNGFTWVKTNPRNERPFLGMGYWTRQNAELCLIAKRGSPKRISNRVSSLVVAPRDLHSRKPAVVRNLIVQVCGHRPRIELFAREKTVGWDCWGNEVESEVRLDHYRRE